MDRIKFMLNGVECSVGCEVNSDKTLLQYIRDDRQLHGTKYMCLEAGCGACIVSVITKPGASPISVNACMVPILTCQDWTITTIEQVGNKKDGYHPLQQEFARQNASQCGYCTPGWIMSAYSLLKSKKNLTMLEMEKSFGSNVCRCTGYRPILETLKSFCSDYPKENNLSDIEDLTICEKTGEVCSKGNCEDSDWCLISNNDIIEINLNDRKKWFIVKFMSDIFQVLNKEGFDSYMLIHGNSAKVPYPISEYPRIIIDISGVEEMQTSLVDQNLIIGSGVTITRLLDILKSAAKLDFFGYLEKVAEHVELVAHVAVRNVGSLGGNLMIKHQHNEFPSDIFLLLQTVGADLTIVSSSGTKEVVSMETFLKINMNGNVILNAMLPPLSNEYEIFTYKVMPRSQNVHATVNAGFLYKIGPTNKVLECTIAYGNLSPAFTRAEATEKFLIGKDLFDNGTLKSALRVLTKELVVTEMPPEASARFRKSLAINLFYKGLLSLCPKSKTNPRVSSGATNIRAKRPVSQARQFYDTDKSLWPLNQPLQKVEGLIQCAGEAQYTDDIPKIANEVYVAFVLTTVATGTIIKIDPSDALKCDGVVSFFSAKDIPGTNAFTPTDSPLYSADKDEELFCNGTVKYFNQPLGIIVAERQKVADEASKIVKVKYANTKPPVIGIKNAMKDPSKVTLYTKIPAKEEGSDTVVKVINHESTIYGQYHFTMETMVCVARPTEEGLQVYTATQWVDVVQTMVARALKLDCSKIDVSVRRLGGAYGFKVSRSCMTAVACSLAAYKLNRPCRLVQPLRVNTRCMGKRLPCKTEWEFAVNKAGAIQHSNLNIYEDHGYIVNEAFYLFIVESINNCYDKKRWSSNVYNVITDTPSNTWFRAPGTLETVAMAEFKMERIAYELSLDPIEVRLANLDPQYNELQQMIDTVKKNSNYEQRNVNIRNFNAGNRWIKRGMALVPIRWSTSTFGIYEVVVSICHGDGSVVIVHGGVEMGQGLNTKAIQICAHMLDVPVEKIQVKPNSTITVPNCFISGGSITSQNVCFGVKKCCEKFKERLAPVYEKLDNPTWEEVVASAHQANISLIAHASHRAQDFVPHTVYGVGTAEVEIDVLTGECEILRVDLLEDVGQSINPAVDIGQIEGAFVMGLGYWTCEKLVYNQKTGELLTDRAWNYHVALARDVPQDFRVYMRKQSYSNDAAFGAKCVGEPPLCMSVVVPLAIRRAISAARLDAGIPTNEWFPIDGPYNLESIAMSTGTELEHMVFY